MLKYPSSKIAGEQSLGIPRVGGYHQLHRGPRPNGLGQIVGFAARGPAAVLENFLKKPLKVPRPLQV
jgi:hypothetical protein